MGPSDTGRNRDPYSVALDALRLRLRSGALVLGEPLTISDVARTLGLSATPVREALARLAGEGLVEDRRGKGYFARRLDGVDLAELYGLRRLYLLASLSASAALTWVVPAPGEPTQSPSDQAAQMMLTIVSWSDNQALLEAYGRVCDRLAPALAAELRLLPLEAEAGRLASASNRDELGAVIEEIHALRHRRAPDIARVIRGRGNISTL